MSQTNPNTNSNFIDLNPKKTKKNMYGVTPNSRIAHKVLDFTQFGNGPSATAQLSDNVRIFACLIMIKGKGSFAFFYFKTFCVSLFSIFMFELNAYIHLSGCCVSCRCPTPHRTSFTPGDPFEGTPVNFDPND